MKSSLSVSPKELEENSVHSVPFRVCGIPELKVCAVKLLKAA